MDHGLYVLQQVIGMLDFIAKVMECRTDIKALDKVQKKFTKVIPVIRDCCNMYGLGKPGLFSLKQGRL